MDSLEDFRREIDGIDDRLVDLLGQRFAVCRKVAAYKLAHRIPVHLPERIAAVKDRCAERGVGHAIRPEFLLALYDLIIEETCRVEAATQEHLSGPSAQADPNGPSAQADPSDPSAQADPSDPSAQADPSGPSAQADPSDPSAQAGLVAGAAASGPGGSRPST